MGINTYFCPLCNPIKQKDMEKITRKQFITRVAAGVSALSLGNILSAFSADKTYEYDPSQTVTLGATGIQSSLLGFGTGVNGFNNQSRLTRQGYDKACKLLRQAFERGVRYYDAADVYGTEPYIGKAFEGVRREDYVLGSKYWCRPSKDGKKPAVAVIPTVEKLLKEAKTDYLDIMQLHCIVTKDWNTEFSDVMTDLDKLKEQGKIRAHGLSTHHIDAMRTAADEAWVDVAHVRINPFDVKTDAPHEEVMTQIQKMKKRNVGIIAMKIFGEGQLNEEQRLVSLKYAASRNLGVLNIGYENIAQIDNVIELLRKEF